VRHTPESNPPQDLLLWTRGTAAREALATLDRAGIDVEPLLAKAGLSREGLLQERIGMSPASQYRFLELAAMETNDPLLGLHLAAEMDLRSAGILFYLAASSASVAQALEHLARYAATTNEDTRLELSRDKDDTVLATRHVLALDEHGQQFSEFLALAIVRMLRNLTNRDFVPSRITFAHGRRSGLREVHRMLGCPVEFSQPTDSWVLPQSATELPIVSRDSQLLQILEVHADYLIAERRTAEGLRGVVESHLVTVLPSGKVQAAEVAKQLGMSTRTFGRHLAQEGTSFGEILDRVRNRLSLRYLENDRNSLQQIAWLLGYSELAAFNHAFKRWFGTSPSRQRKLRAAGAAARQSPSRPSL
jgi:AraC-like DNA-binding protein